MSFACCPEGMVLPALRMKGDSQNQLFEMQRAILHCCCHIPLHRNQHTTRNFEASKHRHNTNTTCHKDSSCFTKHNANHASAAAQLLLPATAKLKNGLRKKAATLHEPSILSASQSFASLSSCKPSRKQAVTLSCLLLLFSAASQGEACLQQQKWQPHSC